jgi:broad specificity phosphatase PhoE
MNKMTTFYLVRHGQTEWNVKDLLQGTSDSPLTEKGLNDAKNAAKNLKKIKFDLAFSSDLLRAKKTAEIIALEHKLEVETNILLRERYFGHLEGKPNDEYRKWVKAFTDLTDKERFTAKISPNIESDEEIATRLLKFIREIAIGYPGKKILAVSHGGIIKTLLIHLGYGTYKQIKMIRNGGYVKLESDGTQIFIKEVKGVDFYEE